ncbi:MAG: hypothetical protein LBG44_05150 [Gemmatimonadota bacterium]|nr:hypothetical protein [Gemmatimonadota bacterium]
MGETSPENWRVLGFSRRREILVALLKAELEAAGFAGIITDLRIEPGPIGREYDLTALVETDVGRLRTPLWSHARAMLYCDSSLHASNRVRFDPTAAIREATHRLRDRLAVPFRLESRGLTITLPREGDAERSWTAEHSLFRKRTAVVREDRVEGASEVDVRDLLARFYTGPSLRLVDEQGAAFFLRGGDEVEGPMITLCHACGHWSEGTAGSCSGCASDAVDTIIAARVPAR